MYLPKIQGAEVCEEGLINQIIIDAEVESVLARLWWVLITDPIETSGNDLNGLISVSGTLTCRALTCFRCVCLYHLLYRRFIY